MGIKCTWMVPAHPTCNWFWFHPVFFSCNHWKINFYTWLHPSSLPVKICAHVCGCNDWKLLNIVLWVFVLHNFVESGWVIWVLIYVGRFQHHSTCKIWVCFCLQYWSCKISIRVKNGSNRSCRWKWNSHIIFITLFHILRLSR